MKRSLLLPLVPLAFAGCERPTEPEEAAVSPTLHSSSAAGGYTAVDLGTLGGDDSWAYDINNRGQVVGWSQTSSSPSAFLWEDGEMTDLGPWGVPQGINDRGQVVGRYYSSGTIRALLWERGEVTDLGDLGGGHAEPFGINNRGQVVGTSVTSSGELHAFLWENGVMIDLGSLGGNAYAFGVNER